MKRFLTIVALLSVFTIANAQDVNIAMQVVASGGGYAVNSAANISLSWTIGEVAYATLTSSDFILSQGFQQGNLLKTSVNELPQLPSIGLGIYPNPVSETLFITIQGMVTPTRYHAEVYDLSGRRVIETLIQAEPNTPYALPVQQLQSGTYIIRVRTQGAELPTTLKFVKQ